MRSLSIGATGMLAQQRNVEVTSNNIANMTSAGYKRQRSEFVDLLYQNVRRPGAATTENGQVVPSGLQMGAGVKVVSTYRIHSQGDLTITDNNLDLAINGPGYFAIELPDGNIGYTRNGSFQLAADGTIVTADGYPLSGAGAIPAGTQDIEINQNGQVIAFVGNNPGQQVGVIDMAAFANPSGLEAIGNSLFLPTEASGAAQQGNAGVNGLGTINQGALEVSNVNVVEEITNLITAQRAYEMNSRVISTSDEMMSTVTNLR